MRLYTEVVRGGGDLDAEIELLRRLAASGDLEALAEALDRSVVYIPAADWVRDMSRCSARSSSHVYRDARFGFRCARSAR